MSPFRPLSWLFSPWHGFCSLGCFIHQIDADLAFLDERSQPRLCWVVSIFDINAPVVLYRIVRRRAHHEPSTRRKCLVPFVITGLSQHDRVLFPSACRATARSSRPIAASFPDRETRGLRMRRAVLQTSPPPSSRRRRNQACRSKPAAAHSAPTDPRSTRPLLQALVLTGSANSDRLASTRSYASDSAPWELAPPAPIPAGRH